METVRTKPKPFPHLRELDGVRGIAAVAVFFHHLCFTSIEPTGWQPFILGLRSISQHGAAGVDIFFVLSGFLITSLLIRDRESPSFYRDFYWKRALRILPVYIVTLICVLLFVPHSGSYVLLSALFIVNFANVFHVETIGPFWSLAIEEQFYLVWPTVVRRVSVARLRNFLLMVITCVILFRFIIAATTGHHNYFLTLFRCDGLVAGALLACGFERRQRENLKPTAHDPLLLAILAFGILLWFSSFIVPTGANSVAIGASIYQTAITLICSATVGLIIAHTGSKALGILRSAPLTFMGLISYAFYLFHMYVMEAYDHFRPLVAGDTKAYWARFFFVFAITTGMALVSRYLIELPALSLRGRVLRKPAPEPESALPLFHAHHEDTPSAAPADTTRS
jgi:peptidoglycan/LPS O-acetylase OafA/YrhL